MTEDGRHGESVEHGSGQLVVHYSIYWSHRGSVRNINHLNSKNGGFGGWLPRK